jgi:hypothetical protein
MQSNKGIWTGRVLSGLVILFLAVDGAMKLVPIAPVTEAMIQLGYPASADLARGLGVLTLVCTAPYAFPRTWSGARQTSGHRQTGSFRSSTTFSAGAPGRLMRRKIRRCGELSAAR